MSELRTQVERCLANFEQRRDTAKTSAEWLLFHRASEEIKMILATCFLPPQPRRFIRLC